MIIENDIFKLSNFKKKNITSEYLSWVNNKKLLRYSRNQSVINFQKANSYINQHDNKNKLFLLIKDKRKNKNIGTLTIYVDPIFKIANIGILIGNKNYLNKGYGYKIYKLVIKHLFKLKIHKIIIGTRKENIPMIKICLKLKMRLLFEESQGIYKYQHYYLKNKNSHTNWGVIPGESGSKNQIISFLNFQKKIKIISLFTDRHKFSKQKKIYFLKNLRSLIIVSDQILVGTGNDFLQKETLRILNINQVKYSAVIDHFTNIYERFKIQNKIYLPNKIWLFEKDILDKIPKKLKSISLLKPNYYLRDIKKNIKPSKKKFIVYFTEPFNKQKNMKFTTDYYSMIFFLNNIYKHKKFRKYEILIKLHPKYKKKQIKDLFKQKIKKFKIKIIDESLALTASKVKFAFGLTTTAMLLMSKLGIETYHCKLPYQKVRLWNSDKIKSFYRFLKQKKISFK